MVVWIMLAALGAAVVLLGLRNMRGEINAVHWYHSQRVKQEDQAAFGRLMGVGTMACGAGIALFGALMLLAEAAAQPMWITVGSCLSAACVAVGVGLFIYATKKYNQGVF